MDAMNKIEPLERFEHAISFNSAPEPQALATADVIILDLPAAELAQTKEFCPQNAYIVVCTAPEDVGAIAQAWAESADDIWLKPLTPTLLAFKLHRLFQTIKLKKDFVLCQTYLDTVIDSSPSMIWFKDLQGRHLKVNKEFSEAVGKPKSDIEGREHYYIWDIPEEEYKKGEYVCIETEDIVLQERKTCLFDEQVKSRYGMRQFKTYKSPIFDEHGEIIGTVGIGHDITDLANLGAELEILLRSMPFGILIKDAAQRIINVNDKFESDFQITKDSIIGNSYEEWKQEFLKHKVSNEGNNRCEVMLNIDGKNKFFEIYEEPILDIFKNEVGLMCICMDTTIEKTLREEILFNANTDLLTGLYNRRYFYEYIQNHLAKEQINVLYMDLDNFKSINDSYGHQIGDKALKEIGRLMQATFPDNFVARIGGDEFLIVVLGRYDAQELRFKAQMLLEQMKKAFGGSDKFKALSASIGISSMKNSEMSIDELIRQSDMALYQAKRLGKSRCCFYAPQSISS